jgi:hypothetical protein
MSIEEKIIHWKNQISEITKKVKGEFDQLNEQELNWKPDGKSWSIAQNLDHLIKINSSYFPVIEKVKKGEFVLPFSAKVPFIVNTLGNYILKSVEPETRKKIKTFPRWEPSKNEISGDIVSRFEKHQKDLATLIQSSSGLLKNGAIISSPANKYIIYKLDKAFDILTAHEMRHLNQALGVKALLFMKTN